MNIKELSRGRTCVKKHSIPRDLFFQGGGLTNQMLKNQKDQVERIEMYGKETKKGA